MRFLREYRLLILIVVLGFFLRFVGLNWDQGMHLHPDERFLTMVGTAMKLPETIGEYFNPATSPLNPTNIGFPFYVYGMFPVILNKMIAVFLGNDNYTAFTLQARGISALLDLVNIVLVFLLTRRFQMRNKLDRRLPYGAAFFYAIAVLPIQLAHFFTVDTFLTTFLLGALYFATDKKTLALSAVSFALAFSSKVNAILFLPLILFFVFSEHKKRWLVSFFFFGVVSYAVLRIISPYYFDSPNVLNPIPNKHYLSSLKTLQSLQNVTEGYPPGIQWIKKLPVVFSLINIAFFGVGIAYFVLIAIGIADTLKKGPFRALLIWTLVIFFYQSVQLVQSMRYFLPLYPHLAIFAGAGTVRLLKSKKKGVAILGYVLIVGSILWPLAFISIYLRNHTRVDASQWIYKNAENGSIILTEHWDDALPLPITTSDRKTFTITELPVFAPDTDEKWKEMNELFNQGDYYVLSSNRGWGSIPTVPELYPKMSAFYKDLLAGKTQYKKVQEFTSYPSFQYLRIPVIISDQWAEEAFSVYDHPVVLIFKKE